MGYDFRRLGDAIRDDRTVLKLTQAELAEAAGVSVNTIKNLESGRESKRWPKSIAPVARALGWPADRARAIARGTYAVGVSAVATAPSEVADEDFEQVLRDMNIGEDLRQVLIDAYRRDRAKDDEERRKKYLDIARSAST